MDKVINLSDIYNQKKDLKFIKIFVDKAFSKYENLSTNEMILKKEFDKVYNKIGVNEELTHTYINDTYSFLNDPPRFDEDNISVFPIIIHTLLSNIFKDKYLNNSLDYKKIIVKALDVSEISYSYYKQAGDTLLDDKIKNKIIKISKKDDMAFRYCETMLTERDYNYKYDINDDYKYLDEVYEDGNNKNKSIFSSYEIDDVYDTCSKYLKLLRDFEKDSYFFSANQLENFEIIKSINHSDIKDKNTFIEIVKKIDSLDIGAINKISKVLDVANRYVTDDNKIVEVDFNNKKKK